LTAALYLSFVGALAAPASAQLDQWGYWENGVTESWWLSSDDFTKEDAVNAVARWKSIGVNNKNAPGGEWEGDYFSGSDTHGTYMRWSPQAGFIISHVDKCQAKVMGVSYGRVDASPTLVQFFPEFSKESSSSHGHSHSKAPKPSVLRFVPVEWRGQRMLVGEGTMSDFGDYVAGLGKYNYGGGFLYLGYVEFLTKREVGGGSHLETESAPPQEETGAGEKPPVVPPGYERFLKKPIEATITAIGKRRVQRNYSYENPNGSGASYERASLTFVTVNVGTAHGVKVSMFLRVAEPAEGDEVRIIRAGKVSSTGVVIRSVDESGETFFDSRTEQPQPHSKVAVGWKLTTSPF